MHPHSRGLALLLSIGSLPIACNKDSEESDSKDSDSTGTSSTGGGSGTSSGTTGGAPTTSGDSVGGTTSTSGEPTTAASMGFITTNTTSSTGGDTEMLPPVTDPTCIAYGDHLTQCYPRYEQYFKYYAYYCQYIKMYAARTDGQACVDALEAQFVCLTKVACGDFMKDPPPCAAEIAAVDPACPSLVETGTSSGGSSDGGGGSSGP
ncbi:MAG: hypothetical protein IPO88_02465 [Nannocystis sp.]|uniref:hypothetical protein n=1 Tax=Nannocystis sp. TaxID=1962667 RepID=UPI0024296DCF|nr:hypothetical protein [Nannocystis sp.]MBK9752367.1 hypothetical protein [Nannocystis sp.]